MTALQTQPDIFDELIAESKPKPTGDIFDQLLSERATQPSRDVFDEILSDKKRLSEIQVAEIARTPTDALIGDTSIRTDDQGFADRAQPDDDEFFARKLLELNTQPPPDKRTASDAFRKFLDNPIKAIPFIGGAVEVSDLGSVFFAAKRIEDGTATNRDKFIVAQFARENIGDKTIGNTVVGILTELPAFAGEFALTGGLFTLGRKGAKEGAKKLVARSIRERVEKSFAGKVAIKGVGFAGGAAVQTAAFPHRALAFAIQRSLPAIDATDANNIAVEFAKPDQSFVEAVRSNLGAGFLDTYIEVASERTGIALLPVQKLLGNLKGAVLKRWLARNTNKTANDFLDAVKSKTAWNGILGEMFEERVGAAARFATGLDDELLPSADQLIAEAIAFSIPGAGRTGINILVGNRRREVTQEQAERIASTEGTPSREDVRGVVEPSDKVNASERARIKKSIQEQLDAQARTQREAARQPTEAEEAQTQEGEVTDAQAIPSVEAEVRPEEGREDIRRQRQVQEAAKPTGKKPEAQVTGKLDRLEQQARERIKKRVRRVQGPPGTRTGAAPLFSDIVDVGIIAGARLTKAGIKGGRVATELVNKVIAEINPALSKVAARVRRIAVGLAKDAEGDEDLFNAAVAGLVAKRKRPVKGRKVKAQIEKSTGLKRKEVPTIGKAEALRAGLGKAVKAARGAFRAGVHEGEARIRASLPAIRKKVADALRSKQDVRDVIRKEIKRVVEENLPPSRRGRFLTDVLNAKTMLNLQRSISKIFRELARSAGDRAIVSITRLTKKKRLKKLTVDRRNEIRKLKEQADALAPFLKQRREAGQKAITNAQIERAAQSLIAIDRSIREIFAQHKAENAVLAAYKRATRDQFVAEAKANIAKARKPKGGRAGRAPIDRQVNWFTALRRGFHDLRKMLMDVENKYDGNGVLHRLLFDGLTKAEEAYSSAVRDLSRKVDAAVRKAGFKSLGEAMAKLSGNLGEGLLETITVTMNGKQVNIPLGEAVAIAAMDETTLALLDRKAKVQFSEGREQEATPLSREEVEAIREQLDPKLLQLVLDLKAIIESVRPELYQAIRRLKGWEPDVVPGYWPRQRNIRFSDDVGLPSGWTEIVARYLENMGFTKERTGGVQAPIVIQDVFTTVLNHLDNAAKLIHLAEPVRNGAMVAMHPEVITAINERFGSQMNRAIAMYLAVASRANDSVTSRAARFISFLNSNIAVSALAINPGTWFAQLGGIFRLAPFLGRDLAAGLAGAKSVRMSTLVNGSGYFWNRYVANIFGRFSATIPEGVENIDQPEIWRSVDGIIRDLLAGDFHGAIKAWRRLGQASMGMLNLFDAVNAKVAWAAMAHRIERLHPEWSAEKKQQWIAHEAAALVRETQNSSSALDQSLHPVQHRNDGLSSLWLFLSDPLKARNRIQRAWNRNKLAGATQATAELASIVWAITGRHGYKFALGYAMWALYGGDEDDWQRIKNQLTDKEELFLRLASEVLSTVDPLILSRIIRSVRFRESVLDFPLISAFDDFGTAFYDLGVAVKKLSERDQETAIRKSIIALDKMATTAISIALGNPLHSLWRRISKETAKQTDEPAQLNYPRSVTNIRDELNRLKRIETAVDLKNLKPEERRRLAKLKIWRSGGPDRAGYDEFNKAVKAARATKDTEKEQRLRKRLESWSLKFAEK